MLAEIGKILRGTGIPNPFAGQYIQSKQSSTQEREVSHEL
jgi:hypothetical protein